MGKVIVAGSINMDIFASVKFHPKVGETVLGSELKYLPGGKGANQAIASAKLGAETTLIGKIGDDLFGKKLIEFFKEQKVDTKIFIEKDISTGTAVVVVSKETANNTIVVIPGANFLLKEQDFTNINFEKRDVLISQFEIPIEVIIAFFKKGKEMGTINIFNPAPAQNMPDTLLNLVDILVLNETEFSSISGMAIDVSSGQSIINAIKKIQKTNLSVVVTLGEKGVVAIHNGEVLSVTGRKVEAVDTTGAGDCFVGAFGASLAEGKSFMDCLKFANVSASISVTRKGAGPSMPNLEEVISLV